jgi:hypothetical protein
MWAVGSSLQYVMDRTILVRHELPSMHFNFSSIIFLCGNLISAAAGLFTFIIDYMLLSLLRTDFAQRYAGCHILHIKCILQECGLKLWFGVV